MAAQVAVTSVFTGQIWGVVGGGAGVVGMNALAAASGCFNNENENPDFPLPTPYFMTGCRKVTGGDGCFTFYFEDGTPHEGVCAQLYREMVNIEFLRYSASGNISYFRVTYVSPNGTLLTQDKSYNYRYKNTPPFGVGVPLEGGSCVEQAPDTPPLWQPNTPIAPPYEYTDPETGCTWQIQAYDSYLNSAGQPVFHWRATSDNPTECGGPYEWWGNGQEPDIPSFPDPREDDPRPTPPQLPPGPGQDIKDDLDKIKEELEKLKDCACPEKPVQEGDYRTISFRSDEKSPFSNARLRKRFKYRSKSGLDLGAIVNHWADFEFAAGPVAVGHVGSALGSPQVWAATADEGKRVIRHAGGEAGINPDQVGEWRIGSSDNARYGVSGQMRVDTTGGYYWITARDGSDGPPIVVRT